MQQTKLKMWTGVGTCLLTLASSTIVGAQTVAKPEVAAAKTGYNAPADAKSEGGEGGEGDTKKPAFVSKISGKKLLTALQSGGYVIFFRHAQTEKDYADQADPKLDLNNCATQRALNDKGIEQAKGIGVAFKEANIPVGLVLASDYCRAWKTADLAFGHYKRTPALNFVKAEEYTKAQKQQMSRAITPLLAAKPVGKVNTVIVGHDDVFDAATGIYPEPQGMAYILKPKGHGKFEILANMQSGEWAMLPK
jgi:phosphohistidine phosphatase SixA